MKAIQLEDLIPEKATFTLKATGDRVHTLRELDLGDQVWLKGRFGEKEIERIFNKRMMPEICVIVMRLLEDRTGFEPERVMEKDFETGEEKEVFLTGPEKLQRCIAGLPEQQTIFLALLKTIGISQPVLDKLIEEEEKKSHQGLVPQYAGEKSTTSSPQSTSEPATSSAG